MRYSLPTTLRTYPWRHQLLSLAPLALVLLLITSCIGVGDDVTLYFEMTRAEHPRLTEAVTVLTDWTTDVLYCGYVLVLAHGLFRRNPRQVRLVLFFALVQLCMTVIVVQFFKISIGRPRPVPSLAGAEYRPWVLDTDAHSFPSGHSAEIAGAASLPAVLLRRYGITLCMGLLIGAVCFSRIYLSRHHLSDVVAGSVAGVVASLLTYYLYRRESV